MPGDPTKQCGSLSSFLRKSSTVRATLVLTISVLSASCETFWTRQDGNNANSGFISIGSTSFQAVPSQPLIASPAINAVTIHQGDQLLFVTSKMRSFDIFHRNGASRCHIDTGIELTAAPTIVSNTVYVGGLYGNVWSIDTKACTINSGWPYKPMNAGSIVGPAVFIADLVIVAAAGQKNEVIAINTIGPLMAKWRYELPSEPTGSMAMTPVKWGGGFVLFAATKEGGVVALDPLTGTELKKIPTGELRAGVSIGSVGDQRVVVVPENGPMVRAFNVDPVFTPRWDEAIVGASPSTARFEQEASIANGSVYLTTGTHLVGLRLDNGDPKWPATDLKNSAIPRPASDNHDNVYVANGTVLQVYRGADGVLLKSTPVTTGLQLILRPTIARDGTVITGDSQSILQFH